MTSSIPKQAVFVGDSLIQWFTREGSQYWKKYFADNYNCINVGVPGITTDETIHRLTTGQLLEIDPNLSPSDVRKVCPLLIGTNDIGMRYDERYISDQIKLIIGEFIARHQLNLCSETFAYVQITEILQKKLQGTKILLIGILPRGTLSEQPAAINEIISQLGNGDSVRYLDLTNKFCSIEKKSGKIKLHSNLYCSDQLHLSSQGYKVWAEEMLPLFKEMMEE